MSKAALSEHSRLAAIVRSCKTLTTAREAHAQILEKNQASNIYLLNLLVEMYGKCGSIEEATHVFQAIRQPNLLSTNIMLAAYVRSGHLGDAASFFVSSAQRDVITWTCMLQCFAQNQCVSEAGQMLLKMANHNLLCLNIMISAYARKGHLSEAKHLFQSLPEPDLMSVNLMLQGFLNNGDHQSAERLFHRHRRDVVTWNSVASAYAQNGAVHLGLAMFLRMPNWSLVSCNGMINAYVQVGDLEGAKKLFFDGMKERDSVSWNTMICAFAQNGCFDLFDISFNLVPLRDQVSFVVAISALAEAGQVDSAKELFDGMPQRNVVTWNAMISAFTQNGRTDDARSLLARIPMRNSVTLNIEIGVHCQDGDAELAKLTFNSVFPRDVFTWSALIQSCAQNGDCCQQAKDAFDRIPNHSITLICVMITLCSQTNSFSFAKRLFDQAPERSLVIWNALLTGYGHSRDLGGANKSFNRMPGWDTVTWSTMVAGRCLQNFQELDKFFPAEAGLSFWNSIMSSYAQHGSVPEVLNIFQKMVVRDTISWTCLIAANAHSGKGREAIQTFHEMNVEGVRPNQITFMSLLVACSHLGWIDEACGYVMRMKLTYNLTPCREHYCAVIDMLARAGQLAAAKEFTEMFLPDCSVSWGALLGACKVHGNLQLGVKAADHVLNLDPSNTAPHVLLRNMYSIDSSNQAR